ncbi:MAG: lipocalin family protein [Verrucomicrobia bacterium]|nr:lipocalin family protein [Verrucomicrobiota bacterium]
MNNIAASGCCFCGAIRALVSARQAVLTPAALLLMGLGLTSCSPMNAPLNPPATAKTVDLSRYAGRWFEIARLPMPFQKADEAAIAEYGINPDGTLAVHNIAIRPDGSQHDILGDAKVLNPPANTQLAVRFRTWFGPLIPVPKEGNYWVLHVDDSYQEAIVGTPDRKYLWLLARTATMPGPRYAALVTRAEARGFEVSRLIKSTVQSPALP